MLNLAQEQGLPEAAMTSLSHRTHQGMHWAKVGDKQADGARTVALCPPLRKRGEEEGGKEEGGRKERGKKGGEREEGGRKENHSQHTSERANSLHVASVEILQLMPRTGAGPCPSRRLQPVQSAE